MKIKAEDLVPINRDIIDTSRDNTLIQERIFLNTCILAKCPLDERGRYSGEMGTVRKRIDVEGELIAVEINYNMSFLLGSEYKDGKEYKGHHLVKEAFDKMSDVDIRQFNPVSGKWIKIPLFSMIEGNIYNGKLKAKIDPYVWKAYEGAKLPYNRINIRIAARLEGCLALQTYERFCSLNKPLTFTIEKYRVMTGCENKYPNAKDFIRWNVKEPLTAIAKEGKIIPYTINRASSAKQARIVSFTVYPETNSLAIKKNVHKKGLREYFDPDEVSTMYHYFEEKEIYNNIQTFLSVKWYSNENLETLINKLFLEAHTKGFEHKPWIIDGLKKSCPIDWK